MLQYMIVCVKEWCRIFARIPSSWVSSLRVNLQSYHHLTGFCCQCSVMQEAHCVLNHWMVEWPNGSVVA